MEYVVEYSSRLFKGYEIHMSISEKEMASAVYGIKEFCHLLIGLTFILVITAHLHI